jgi:hypothetical protein
MAWTAVIFVLALAGTGWGAAAPTPKTVAADQPYEQEQPGEKTIVAVVQNVETYERSMTVLDTWGQATMFDLGAASIYTSSKNYEELAAVDDLRTGQKVQVTYSGPPDSPKNLKVVILSGEPLYY